MRLRFTVALLLLLRRFADAVVVLMVALALRLHAVGAFVLAAAAVVLRGGAPVLAAHHLA